MSFLQLPSRVVVVAGPTAVGKSAFAVTLAEALGAEIVGADSRQVVRYMEAGTAKPEAELRERVPHHLLDLVDPNEAYDVAKWRSDALTCLADLHARGRPAVVCGGTGLYLKSLERGLFQGPSADAGLRARLAAEEQAEPGSLLSKLHSCDPVTASRLHANDHMRLIRALEVFELTGRPLSQWLREHALAEKPFEVLTLELQAPVPELDRRIALRAEAIVGAGIVEELGSLRERFGRDARALNAIGYREAGAVLDGDLDASELAPAISLATRRYAKRQRTWLRGQASTQAFAANEAQRALGLAETFLS